MLSAALLLFANTLLFSLRISGGGSFPKPLSAAEEQHYLQLCAQGDSNARNILIERNLRLVAHIVKKYYAQNTEQEAKKFLEEHIANVNHYPDVFTKREEYKVMKRTVITTLEEWGDVE